MINLELGFAFEADGLAGAKKSLDLLQAQFLCFVHVDGQSSACHPLQAHLVLESHLPFRLILYWTRLERYEQARWGYNGVVSEVKKEIPASTVSSAKGPINEFLEW